MEEGVTKKKKKRFIVLIEVAGIGEGERKNV